MRRRQEVGCWETERVDGARDLQLNVRSEYAVSGSAGVAIVCAAPKREDGGLVGWLRYLDWHISMRHSQAFLAVFSQSIDGVGSVLDVGCGSRSPLAMLSPRPFAVGIDSHLPSLQASKAAGIHDEVAVGDALELVDTFGMDSFDAVIAMDVIEHLPKEQGWELLRQMETVARRRVIVFTPNGFLPQVRSAVEANPAQEHVSGWTASEFRDRGYTVTGINGWRRLRGPGLVPTIKPTSIGLRVSMLSQPLVQGRPDYAFQLFAVRQLDA